MIRVLLVDDHRLVRASLRAMLVGVDGIQVVGEAASGEEAVESARRDPPDVVLMDMNMPGVGGLVATRRLATAAPSARVIALTAHREDPYPEQMLDAGAAGYLTKDCEPDEVVAAIRRVADGGTWIESEVARRIADDRLRGKRADGPFASLSGRELEVLQMLVNGASTTAIAESLGLSPKTVATYRYRLHEKLGVANDIELVRFALRHGAT